MAKVILDNVTSGFTTTTLINSNNDKIEAAFENTLSRDGTAPNFMNGPLDMNGNLILNQANPITVEGFRWLGPWQSAYVYVTGDVIEINNSSYICIVNHISGVFVTDLAAAKWQVVASSAALPSQSGHGGDILSTDGSNALWSDVNTIALPIGGGTLTGSLIGTTAHFTGQVNADTDVIVGDQLTVVGATQLNSILGVTGTVTISGDLDISGTPTGPTAVANTNTTQFATTAFVKNESITISPLVTTTSGTSIIITNTVPIWAKRVTLLFSGVSTNGTSPLLVQLGDAGGFETTLYSGESMAIETTTPTVVSSGGSGFIINSASAGDLVAGKMILDSFTSSRTSWIQTHNMRGTTSRVISGAGSKTLTQSLDSIRITTVGGTATFDAGSIAVLYE